jgi:hypothetical protein
LPEAPPLADGRADHAFFPARPSPASWSPALNETFTYGVDRIRGVNLGGWLNTEPFIVPGLYEKYYNATPRAVDEYTLCQAMGANKAAELEEHYKTFITEQDLCVPRPVHTHTLSCAAH